MPGDAQPPTTPAGLPDRVLVPHGFVTEPTSASRRQLRHDLPEQRQRRKAGCRRLGTVLPISAALVILAAVVAVMRGWVPKGRDGAGRQIIGTRGLSGRESRGCRTGRRSFEWRCGSPSWPEGRTWMSRACIPLGTRPCLRWRSRSCSSRTRCTARTAR